MCIRDRAYTSNGATLSVLLYLRAFEDGDFASAWGIGAVLLLSLIHIFKGDVQAVYDALRKQL